MGQAEVPSRSSRRLALLNMHIRLPIRSRRHERSGGKKTALHSMGCCSHTIRTCQFVPFRPSFSRLLSQFLGLLSRFWSIFPICIPFVPLRQPPLLNGEDLRRLIELPSAAAPGAFLFAIELPQNQGPKIRIIIHSSGFMSRGGGDFFAAGRSRGGRDCRKWCAGKTFRHGKKNGNSRRKPRSKVGGVPTRSLNVNEQHSQLHGPQRLEGPCLDPPYLAGSTPSCRSCSASRSAHSCPAGIGIPSASTQRSQRASQSSYAPCQTRSPSPRLRKPDRLIHPSIFALHQTIDAKQLRAQQPVGIEDRGARRPRRCLPRQ